MEPDPPRFPDCLTTSADRIDRRLAWFPWVVSAGPEQTVLRARGLFIACALVAFSLLAGSTPPAASAKPFQRLDSSGIEGAKLYDLGAADYNDDGLLDVFTTNHKFNSTLLAGDGRGGFTDTRVAAGLSPTQAFPGYEELRREPDRSGPGVYLYATRRDEPRDPFHIATTAVAASGTITFNAQDLRVENATGATVTTSRLADGSSQLHFNASPGAQIDVSVEHIDLPVGVSIDGPTDPAQILVGADAVPATARQLILTLRDRHGFGFADFDGDLSTDLLIATGGLGGGINEPFFAGRQSDELLLSRPGGYENATQGSGLAKGVCRGRSVRLGDLDGDGTLDVLETCDAAAPQLYLGEGGGRFQEQPGPPTIGAAYRFLDLDADPQPELLVAVDAAIQVWDYANGSWSLAQSVRTLNGEAPMQTLSLGDLDDDGDLDVFAAARGGNTVLLDIDGRLKRRAPTKLGLPQRGTFAGSFVDYDNDGDLDLDLIPQGLYESVDGAYDRTSKLKYGRLPTGRVGYGIVSWPDLDGDGRRDLLSARGRGEFAAEQVLDLRRNTIRRSGHWLEVDLLGPVGNAQSIGATVKVRTDAGREYGWVGQADDSRHGSAHYRIYLGLGEERRVRKLVVRWPDGGKLKRKNFRADRLLRLAAPNR